MKHLWETYKVQIMIFSGIFVVALGVYLNILIAADVKQETPSSIYPVAQPSQAVQTNFLRPVQKRSGKDTLLEQGTSSQGEVSVPSQKGSMNIPILVN